MTAIASPAWRTRSRHPAARKAAGAAPGLFGPINAQSTAHSCVSCGMNSTISKDLESRRLARWAAPGQTWMKQSTVRNVSGRFCRTSRCGCRPRQSEVKSGEWRVESCDHYWRSVFVSTAYRRLSRPVACAPDSAGVTSSFRNAQSAMRSSQFSRAPLRVAAKQVKREEGKHVMASSVPWGSV